MRLIGTLSDEREGRLFARFLEKQGIACKVDIGCDRDWGSEHYGTPFCQIWIVEEDQVEKAVQWFNFFNNHREDPLFDESSPAAPPLLDDLPKKTPQQVPLEGRPMGPITRGVLIICCLLFFSSLIVMREDKIPEKYESLSLFVSPIEKSMLYDYPMFYQLISRFIQLYGVEALENPADIPPDGKVLMNQIEHTPYWQGVYHLWVEESKAHNKEHPTSTPPLFEKIREGEIWRLFSPCLLHGSALHLLFNMLWLIVLGKQLEQRLTSWRYILFMLVTGIISNTAQYLTSGPNFIGFSGILCAMLGFVWVRQVDAPWEGYQIDRLTLVFMLVYVLGMAAVQAVSFFFETVYDIALTPNIANMAHLSGGVMGYLLGKLNYFSWRQS